MDAETIRRRLESVLPLLPDVFTVRDVLRATRLPKEHGSAVRRVLDELVTDGRLFRSFVLHGVGRRPASWSKTPGGTPDAVLAEAVQAVVGRMPSEFTVWDVLHALRLSPKYRVLVLDVLSKLSEGGVVVRLTDRRPTVGRPAVRWSADPAKIAEELTVRERMAQARAWEAARLARLLSPWDPFGDDRKE